MVDCVTCKLLFGGPFVSSSSSSSSSKELPGDLSGLLVLSLGSYDRPTASVQNGNELS